MKITSKTTLSAIRAAVLDDFDIQITNAQAREIRDGRKNNTVVWTPAHLRNVAHDATVREITPDGVRCGAAFYNREEWNRDR